MIKIITKIDSVENDPEAVIFGCKWEIISEPTKSEEIVTKVILDRIQKAFDDIGSNALINGGSVKRTHRKGDNEEE